jgi:hypothetical protein
MRFRKWKNSATAAPFAPQPRDLCQMNPIFAKLWHFLIRGLERRLYSSEPHIFRTSSIFLGATDRVSLPRQILFLYIRECKMLNTALSFIKSIKIKSN